MNSAWEINCVTSDCMFVKFDSQCNFIARTDSSKAQASYASE